MAAPYRILPRCIAALRQIKAIHSRRDYNLLIRTLNRIAANPMLQGSGVSYHDPAHPDARFYRIPQLPKFMVFHRIGDDGMVEFTDVWHTL